MSEFKGLGLKQHNKIILGFIYIAEGLKRILTLGLISSKSWVLDYTQYVLRKQVKKLRELKGKS